MHAYLAQSGLGEYGSSRISLVEKSFRDGSELKFLGYSAEIAFHLLLRELDRIEEILIGITDAGANNINRVDYQTTRLKELRAEARKRAVEEARKKAIAYCSAASVNLGSVIHIEDVNPSIIGGMTGHVIEQVSPDDQDLDRAFVPDNIVVGGAVMIAYKIKGLNAV